MKNAFLLYLMFVAVMSLVTWVAYWLDKRRATHGSRRIPERTLHLLALLGGWPGAWIGQQQFRHKTQKLSFRIVFWLTVVLHISVVAFVIVAVFRRPLEPPTAANLSQPVGWTLPVCKVRGG